MPPPPLSCPHPGVVLRRRRRSTLDRIDMDDSPRMTGCGLFRRRRVRSTSSIPHVLTEAPAPTAKQAADDADPPRRPRGSEETAIVPVPAPELPAMKPRFPAAGAHAGAMVRKAPEAAKALPQAPAPARVVSGKGIMAELDAMLYDRQRAGGGGNLTRVSSGNVMVYGNLGNLRGNAGLKNPPSRNALDYLPKTAEETRKETQARTRGDRRSGLVVGTAAKEITTGVAPEAEAEAEAGMSRELSKRAEPDELKEMGNAEYKAGRFEEAVALYQRAIVMDPGKASYYSNKAAALAGMGRLVEAVGECKEALRIDPAYYRAHHRLASLYLRLGEAAKAIHHFKLSRTEASPVDISKAQALQSHIFKSNEARKLKDYLTLLKESQSAASSGADSSPQVFAMQAEALLKLQRYDEADSILNAAPKLDDDEFTKFFGAKGSSHFLMIRAQVDMAAGRFEEAVAAAQKATQLDPTSRETSAVARRTRTVAAARSRGNDLFRASKFSEAFIAYGDGLNQDPHNAILLCNRAACRAKLGQYDKAVEDCSAALVVRPSYGKARLRRADCNAKLERWEASEKDYQALIQANPGDEEVIKALAEASAMLKKQQAREQN